MPDATAFNLETGLKAERNLMILYANPLGRDAPEPEWEPLGLGVEDSALEFNFEETVKTDILGVTTGDMGKPQRRQSFEPCEIREGSKLQVKIYNALRYERWSELANMDMLLVHRYAGESQNKCDAERYKGSLLIPQSIGGGTTLDMPFDVILGGDREIGSATYTDGKPGFVAENAPPTP